MEREEELKTLIVAAAQYVADPPNYAALARRLKVKRQAVHGWITDPLTLPPRQAARMAEMLGWPPELWAGKTVAARAIAESQREGGWK